MIRWTAEEREARDRYRKMEREKRDAAARAKITTGAKLAQVDAPVLGKRRKLTPAQKAEVHAQCEGCCHVCGVVLPITGPEVEYDHITERRWGGSEALRNIAPICIPCHREKTARGCTDAAKADRRRAKFNGDKKPSARPLKSKGFDTGYVPLPRGGGFR